MGCPRRMLLPADREDFLHWSVFRVKPHFFRGHKEHFRSNNLIRGWGMLSEHTDKHRISRMQFSMRYDVQFVLEVFLQIPPQFHREVVAQLLADGLDYFCHVLVVLLASSHKNILLLPIIHGRIVFATQVAYFNITTNYIKCQILNSLNLKLHPDNWHKMEFTN